MKPHTTTNQIIREFTKYFFCYRMNEGKVGDHVGAEKDAAAFLATQIDSLLTSIQEKIREGIPQIPEGGRSYEAAYITTAKDEDIALIESAKTLTK